MSVPGKMFRTRSNQHDFFLKLTSLVTGHLTYVINLCPSMCSGHAGRSRGGPDFCKAFVFVFSEGIPRHAPDHPLARERSSHNAVHPSPPWRAPSFFCSQENSKEHHPVEFSCEQENAGERSRAGGCRGGHGARLGSSGWGRGAVRVVADGWGRWHGGQTPLRVHFWI